MLMVLQHLQKQSVQEVVGIGNILMEVERPSRVLLGNVVLLHIRLLEVIMEALQLLTIQMKKLIKFTMIILLILK